MAEQAQEQVKEKAQEATEKARATMRDQVDTRSTHAGEQVTQQAGDLRTLSQELRNQGKDGPAKLAEQAADRTERLGGWLEQSDADQILSEVEDFARRNPWAVALGGLAVGFAASRMLRASSSDRYHGASGGDGVHGRYGRSAPSGLPRPQTPPVSAPYDPPVATTPGAQRYERL
jgi:hypothetical protein